MKTFKIISFFSIFILVYFISFFYYYERNIKTENYCGIILEKYRLQESYKNKPECRIILFSDKLQRKIDVNISFNDYANVEIGNKICVDLSKKQLLE